ncbi:MAG TPA: hypothetical protein VFM16_02595 [Holophagaceae bacterium]|nr:hypothetical protein [Holophagaceae bacterium]
MPLNEALAHRVPIPVGDLGLEGDLHLPARARGLVLFAHGSGSSRHSPRNLMVAERLHHRSLGTLLFDLLTPEEALVDERTRHLRFDLDLLTARMLGATAWALRHPETEDLELGYFGASTGAAAALMAAAELGSEVAAVVSRGGRPDLAGAALAKVQAPTLLIVGGWDPEVLALNRRALDLLPCEKALEIVPGATHLFEETGALERVADLAGAWFARHMGG